MLSSVQNDFSTGESVSQRAQFGLRRSFHGYDTKRPLLYEPLYRVISASHSFSLSLA